MLTAVILLGIFTAVFADQNGRACWCNIDKYGCWVTAEDGGKSYIMFWTEEARQYIMGTLSAPYELVVSHPGFSAVLPLQCGIEASVSIPAAVPADNPTDQDVCKAYTECMNKCNATDTCLQMNCIVDCNAECGSHKDECPAATK